MYELVGALVGLIGILFAFIGTLILPRRRQGPNLAAPVMTLIVTGDVTVTWTPVVGATSYQVELDGTLLPATNSLTLVMPVTFSDVGNHVIRVRAVNNLGSGPFSNSEAYYIGATHIWTTPGANETSRVIHGLFLTNQVYVPAPGHIWIIYVAIDGGFLSFLMTVPATTGLQFTYEVPNLMLGSTYRWRLLPQLGVITASAGISPYSEPYTVTLTVPPNGPLTIAASPAYPNPNTELNVSWVDPTTTDQTSYTITWSGGGGPVTVPSPNTNFKITGLIPNTVYVISVFATNAAGDGNPIVTSAATLNLAAPPPPFLYGISSPSMGYFNVTLNATDNAVGETAFLLFRRAYNTDTTFIQVATLPPSAGIGGSFAFIDPGLTTGFYQYYYVAQTTSGMNLLNGPASNVVSFAISGALPAPMVYTSIAPSALVPSDEIELKWLKAQGPDVTSVTLEGRITAGNILIGTQVLSPGATSYLWTGLDPSTAYTFYLSATNPTGTSAPTAGPMATTAGSLADAPFEPKLTQIASTNSVLIEWTNRLEGETTVQIQRRPNFSGPDPYTVVGTVPGGTGPQSFIDRNVSGFLFRYRLVAFPGMQASGEGFLILQGLDEVAGSPYNTTQEPTPAAKLIYELTPAQVGTSGRYATTQYYISADLLLTHVLIPADNMVGDLLVPRRIQVAYVLPTQSIILDWTLPVGTYPLLSAYDSLIRVPVPTEQVIAGGVTLIVAVWGGENSTVAYYTPDVVDRGNAPRIGYVNSFIKTQTVTSTPWTIATSDVGYETRVPFVGMDYDPIGPL